MAVYNAAVFGLLPLCAEVPLVCAAVSRVSSPAIGVAVALVSLLYIAFTVCMTEVRTVPVRDSVAGMAVPAQKCLPNHFSNVTRAADLLGHDARQATVERVRECGVGQHSRRAHQR